MPRFLYNSLLIWMLSHVKVIDNTKPMTSSSHAILAYSNAWDGTHTKKLAHQNRFGKNTGQNKQFNESPKKRENSFDILRIHAMGKLYLALGLTTFCECHMDTFCQHAALNSSVLEKTQHNML